jgi:hypothetical protein
VVIHAPAQPPGRGFETGSDQASGSASRATAILSTCSRARPPMASRRNGAGAFLETLALAEDGPATFRVALDVPRTGGVGFGCGDRLVAPGEPGRRRGPAASEGVAEVEAAPAPGRLVAEWRRCPQRGGRHGGADGCYLPAMRSWSF